MKTIFVVLSVLLCVVFPAHFAAAIPSASVGVGGISPYATTDYVKSVYGEPTYQTVLNNGELFFAYGESTSIYFSTEKRLTGIITGKDNGSDDLYIVRRIDTRKGSGFVTPGGIGIGDAEKKITAVYGKPNVRVITDEEAAVRLMYVGEAHGEDEGLCFMTFYLKDDHVTKISCYATRH